VAMAKNPRVVCPGCKRGVSGTPTKRPGVVSVADHKKKRLDLKLCSGSMQHVRVAEALFRPSDPQQPTLF
jgi:ribosomal protein L34E